MMLALGMFVFSLHTAAYQEMQRQTEWRHPGSNRIGTNPSRQFLGRGEDAVTLPGIILPELAGTVLSLDALRQMADTGKAWPMVEGTGRLCGLWVIDNLTETRTIFFSNGAARRIEFSLSLKRVDDGRVDLLGASTGTGLNILRGDPVIDAAIARVTGYVNNTLEQARRDATYPVPAFRLTVDGNDLAQKISPRLMSLELTDNRGIEADQLSITLSDHDGLLVIPPKGAILRLWLGWSDTGLVDKGTYTVDETEHSGAPDVLSIRARSADLRKGLKTKRERSWSNTTLGEVLGAIASGNGLKATIAEALGGLPILQLDQANESDANLISRLGEEFDAVATVKSGCLLCMPAGGGKTASGMALPHITLTRVDGDQHRYLQADRDSYDGVRAYYYDVNSAKKQEAIAGGGENLKDLRHTYSDQQSALRAARAEFNRLQRGSATLSYTLARGRPDLIPELTYTLQGVKAEIDEIIWYGGNVQHSLSADNGYTMSLDLESKLPEDTVEDLAEENKGEFTGVIAYYRDDKAGTEKTVTAGDQSKPKRLRWLYASEKTAKRAVEREMKKLSA